MSKLNEQDKENVLKIAKSFCPECLVQFRSLGLDPNEVTECPICKMDEERRGGDTK